MRRVPVAAALAALAVSAPGSALAQSAGDDQYRDPFAGQDSGGQEQAEEPTDTGSSTPVAPSEPTTAPTAAPSSAETSGTLPYTGLPAALVSGAGLLLLAAGFGLRRASR